MRLRNSIAALVVGLPVFAVAGWAQLAPSPDAAPVSNAPAPAPDETPVATFKVNVNLVDMFFTVKDNKGNLVPHLDPAELHGGRKIRSRRRLRALWLRRTSR